DDRRRRAGLSGAPGHRPARGQPRPVRGSRHRRARHRLRPHHPGLRPPHPGTDRCRGDPLMTDLVQNGGETANSDPAAAPDPAAPDLAIAMRGVTKIFGPDPEAALALMRAGRSKAEVQAETGHVVGLDNVSLDIERGQIYVVMGLSGSGKSTLIRHVNRLIDPTAGEIVVNGDHVLEMSLAQLREFRRTRIAMVFQKFGLLPHRSVIDNVAYGLEVRGVGKAERLEKAAHWIEMVGLAGYEKSRPRQLSGGQQQ